MIGFNEIEYASHTDVGVRRSHNQDNHALMPAADDEHWRQIGHVFLVADGMGGHAVGELAAKIAVDNIPHIFSKYAQDGAISALRRAFTDANNIIHTRGQQNREFKGMGTTGTALVLRPEGAWVGHVGDSRAYRIRGGVIEQLTFDHSYLWEMARKQRKNPDELDIQSNIISRSLGSLPGVEVDVEGPHPIERGDIFLLCSDGLSGQVNDRVIGAVVTALSPAEAVRFLVHMANLQGGPDNTTVIVVRVGGEPKSETTDSMAEVVFPASDSNASGTRLGLVAQQLTRVPWAFLLLALGIASAILATILASLQSNIGLYAFIFAGLSLLAGIVSLMIQNYRETQKLVTEPEELPLHVYRQTPCPLDASMYEKLLDAAKTLEQTLKEKNWEYDAKAYQEQSKQAAQHLQNRQYREAFRDQCLAMLVLMDAVHAYRGKNEDFKPIW
ncbi:MAG: serine/threonine-protein phosphatase [Planctomycetes bacterium]|nr:serine/threonine-protein phosphatase [Planctomycetota bacterium]